MKDSSTELAQYYEMLVRKGYPGGEIRAELIRKGYSETEVNDVIRNVKQLSQEKVKTGRRIFE